MHQIISIQGKRTYMEDRHVIDLNFCNENWTFGGVYDGHGGSEGSEYASKTLHQYFASALKTDTPTYAFVAAYELVSNKINVGGTCAATFFIRDGEIFYANVGDSRILIINDKALQLTVDHTPDEQSEADRIQAEGGFIQGQYIFAGSEGLMVTRSLGDKGHKEVGVIPTPYTGSYKIRRHDRFLIAGTDGLFNIISNEDIRSTIQGMPDAQEAKTTLEKRISGLANDNITALIISLKV